MDLELFKKTSGVNRPRKSRNYDEEFSVEPSFEIHGEGAVTFYKQYNDKGVHLYGYDDKTKLVYEGILAKAGASDIYAVIGYGSNDNWEDVKYYPMQHTGGSTFELLIPETSGRSINIAFKDGADNWDNNSGANYTFN